MASDGWKRNYVRSGKVKKGYDYEDKTNDQLFTNEIIDKEEKILDLGPNHFPAVTLADDGTVIYFRNTGRLINIVIDRESYEELNYQHGYIQNLKIGTVDRWMVGHNEIDNDKSTVDFWAEDWGAYEQDENGNDMFLANVNPSYNEIRLFVYQDFNPDGPYNPNAHDGTTLPNREVHLEWGITPTDENGNEISGINCYAVTEAYSPNLSISGWFKYICLISDWNFEANTVVLHFTHTDIPFPVEEMAG